MKDDQVPPPPPADPVSDEIERRKNAAADLVKFLPRIEAALKSADLDAARVLIVSLTESVLKISRPAAPAAADGFERAGSRRTLKEIDQILRNY